MKVENTYDEILFAAAHAALEPDDEDLANVRVPPGEDAASFRQSLTLTARKIAALRKEGNNGAARDLAAQGQREYLSKFEEHLPVPVSEDDDTPTEVLAARMFRSY